MNADRFARIKELAAVAADMDAAARATYLQRECADDEDLRREVESLLACDEGQTVAMTARTVSHYRLDNPIGKGGMGEVFAAQDLKLGRTVAIKFLPSGELQVPDAEKRFINEAQTASSLDHPNIGVIHEIDRDGDQLFIVMGYYEGGSLQDRCRKGALELDEALDLTCQIARGLDAAHERGIIHRDLKPANVVLTPDGTAKIIDFGLAKLAQQQGITRTRTLLGTLAYMSPEQVQGSDVDARSDLFALGVVLYHLVTGALPFKGEHEAATIYSILNDDPESVHTHRPDAPKALHEILTRALAKNPDDRYQSAAEMLANLKALRDRMQPTVDVARPGAPATSSLLASPRKWWLIGAVVTLMIVSGLVGVQIMRSGQDPDSAAEPALAVFDFQDLSGSDDRTLSAGITSLVSIGMVESCPIRVISPEFLYDLRRREFGATEGSIADDQALTVARESGASLLLTGQIGTVDGGRFLTVRLVEAGSGKTISARRFPGEQLTDLADQALGVLLPVIAEHSDQTAPAMPIPTGDLTSTSAQAYQYYVAGVLAKEAHRPTEAIDNLLQAVALDSTFALAQFELSRIFYSSVGAGNAFGTAQDRADRAWALRDRLGEKDRLLLEAWRHRLNYDYQQTRDLGQRMLERWPDDPAILHPLLNDYFYFYYFTEALDVARQGLEHFPDDLDFGLRRTHCLAHLDRPQAALQSARAYVARHPREPNAWDELALRFLAVSLPDSAAASFDRALELDPDFLYSKQGRIYALYTEGDLDGALALNQRYLAELELLPGQRVDFLSSNAFWPGQAMLLAESGRFIQALELFETARAAVSDTVSMLRLETGRSRCLLRMGRAREVLTWARTVADRSESRLADALEVQFTAKALVALDSLSAARAWTERLRETESTWGGVARYEATSVTAAIALQENRAEDALTDLERLATYGIAEGGCLDIERREMTARAYALAGRWAEAEAELLKLLRRYGGHVTARLALGRILEQTGRPEQARTQYEAFLAAWSRADPGLPQIAEARARLDALNSTN